MLLENACSHKGEQRRPFTIEFKKKVVEQAAKSSNREAARRYDVDERRVCEWCTERLTLWLIWLRSKVIQREKDWKVAAEN